MFKIKNKWLKSWNQSKFQLQFIKLYRIQCRKLAWENVQYKWQNSIVQVNAGKQIKNQTCWYTYLSHKRIVTVNLNKIETCVLMFSILLPNIWVTQAFNTDTIARQLKTRIYAGRYKISYNPKIWLISSQRYDHMSTSNIMSFQMISF